VFVLIEGDLRAPAFPYESLLAACINAEIRRNSHVIRSIDADETAMVVRHLCKKAGNPAPGVPSGIAPPAIPKSKRSRDSEEENVWIRQLMCVPSISERIARALLTEFGSLPVLVQALNADMRSFPRVRIDASTCLGKTRIATLSKYLTTRHE
jgi:ERCC4-type nuclease